MSKNFGENCPLRKISVILAALPGAQNPDGFSPVMKTLHMACRDDKQYFSRAQRWGKLSGTSKRTNRILHVTFGELFAMVLKSGEEI